MTGRTRSGTRCWSSATTASIVQHSACYSLQAYQDAYLKAKYPAAFYAALLTYEDDDDKIKSALREAKLRGLEIVFPDVNESQRGYTIDKRGRLVLGLEGIKGVGPNASAEILRKRPFTSFADLLERGGSKISIRPLIESGAVDGLADRQVTAIRSVPRPMRPRRSSRSCRPQASRGRSGPSSST